MCFWPAKTRKILEFFEMHTCLWPGAQIWFRHKRRKLVTASLLLHCIDWYSCLRYWNEFYLSCGSGFRLNFSRIALWRKRLLLDSKSDLTTNWLWGFCWKMASFVDFISVWTEICWNCSIIVLFWRHLMSFNHALQLYFLCLCVLPSSFPASNDRFVTRLHYL